MDWRPNMKILFRVKQGKKTPIEMLDTGGVGTMPKVAYIVEGSHSVIEVSGILPTDTIAMLYAAVVDLYRLQPGTFTLAANGVELSVSDTTLMSITKAAEYDFDLRI